MATPARAQHWHTDRGLQVLIDQWKAANPGAVVGTIAGGNHTRTHTDHVPDAANSVDAADFMAGPSVTAKELDELAETLRLNRDVRIAYVIRRDKIFSSTVSPRWQWRHYTGEYHGHTHVSVNDKHAEQTTRWKLHSEKAKVTMEPVSGHLPVLTRGMQDPIDSSGWFHVTRFQRLLGLEGKAVDGNFGPATQQKYAAWKAAKKRPGRTDQVHAADWKALMGIRG